MKTFLINVAVFSFLLAISMGFVFFIADGKSDPYYLRFTTPRQHSMIIGTSRAAQGLQPAAFDSMIYKNNEHHFYNYAFTLFDSPFGPAYFESIQKKLDPAVKDGIFLLAVDPWSISTASEQPNDPLQFRENKGLMGNTTFVHVKPNIQYLVESFPEPYINIIRKWKGTTDLFLHNDGWFEVDVPMDSTSIAKRLDFKLKEYRKDYLPVYKYSALRYEYLLKIITWLQEHGKVYLVRLPVSPKMFAIENELMPDFDTRMDTVIAKTKVDYLNFKNMENPYQYVDGNHLYKTSGQQVSATIARWMAEKK